MGTGVAGRPCPLGPPFHKAEQGWEVAAPVAAPQPWHCLGAQGRCGMGDGYPWHSPGCSWGLLVPVSPAARGCPGLGSALWVWAGAADRSR